MLKVIYQAIFKVKQFVRDAATGKRLRQEARRNASLHQWSDSGYFGEEGDEDPLISQAAIDILKK